MATRKTNPRMSRAVPSNIIRGRSPFHGIAGIGEEKKKKKEEPAEALKAAAAPAAAAVAAAAAPAPAAAPKTKKRWFWQKEPIPEANPEEKIKPAPVSRRRHGAPEV